ncbi:MAG TPA: glycosyltransferase family 4 protein [Gemmatimonadales bacterium]|nr:glycosyltransferase family 4 protein [Gemmatimonadales bacterium]
MNVGIAVHRYDAGEGTGGYVVELLPHIARRHRVTLYAAEVRAPVPEGVEVVRVPAVMRRAYAAILSFPLALRAVRRAHDLFHAQGWVTSRADVVTAHIVLAAWRRAARDAGIAAPPGERWLGPFVEAREAALLRHAGQVIAPSNLARDQIASHYGRTQDVSVVPHGFPPIEPRSESVDTLRRRFGLPETVPLALYAGDVRKGLRTALAGLRAAAGWHLAVASHSSPRATELMMEDGDLHGRVHWLGAVGDMRSLYQAADLLVHPTICDSFGLVVAEAMACGTPAVTTRQAGIAELIRHEQSGWILAAPEPGALAVAMNALVDGNRRRRLAEGAMAVAAQRTWDAVAAETLAVYERAARR